MKNCNVLNCVYCARLIIDLGGMTATEPQIFLSPSATRMYEPGVSPTLKKGPPYVTVLNVQSTIELRLVF